MRQLSPISLLFHPYAGFWVKEMQSVQIKAESNFLAGSHVGITLDTSDELCAAQLRDHKGVRAGRFDHIDLRVNANAEMPSHFYQSSARRPMAAASG